MSGTSTTQIHLLNLTAKPVQLRVSLHPGIRDYFRDGGSHKRFSARIREVLNAYFFAHASIEDIRTYLGPYEQLPEILDKIPGIITVQNGFATSDTADNRQTASTSTASQGALFSGNETGPAADDFDGDRS